MKYTASGNSSLRQPSPPRSSVVEETNLSIVVASWNTVRFGNWLQHAYMTVPREQRKIASHHGAIICDPGQAAHWVSPCGYCFHDPGNKVYAAALDLLVDDACKRHWNQETKGDIIEGVLGLYYNIRVGHESAKCWHNVTRANITQLAAILHYVAYVVYRIWSKYTCEDLVTLALARASHAVNNIAPDAAMHLIKTHHRNYFGLR